jgi:hypothetical protein
MTEEECYLQTLQHQRHLYRWCLQHVGEQSAEEAHQAAEAFYPYQVSTETYRELVFHDEAWHWAMLHLHGEGYWRTKPELAEPSAAYEKESQRN